MMLLSSCTPVNRNPSISDPAVAKIVDQTTSKPIVLSDRFYQSDPAVYFSVRVMDLPQDTKLKAVWKHIDNGTEIPAEITTEGTGYEVFTLKRNSGLFPSGQYEVTVSTVVYGKTLEVKQKFNIIPENKPSHFMNAVTAKSIDNNDNLNAVDAASEFSQSEPVIYFIVQSKGLPKDTKVSCVWVYIATGDSLSHEIITEGSRNIAFNLKPDSSQKLPAGKYLVTLTANINNEAESISKEFEIR